MGMDALLECGLPGYVHCTTTPRMMGGIKPGIDVAGVYWQDSFVMNIQWFASVEPVHGLLMYDAGPSAHLGAGPILKREEHRWFFFGYRCEQCQHTFLVPSSLKSADYLPNVLHHTCHGDGSVDYAERRIIEGAREATYHALERLILNGVVKRTDGGHVGSMLVLEFEKLALAVWQEMKNF